MSHRSGSSSSMTDNHLFTLQAMQQQFEALNIVLGDVRNRIDRRDTSIRNLQRGRFVPSTPWRAELPKERNSTLASSTSWRTELPNLACSTTWRTELPKVQKRETSSKPKVELQPTRNRDIKCLGASHIASQFPNQQVMNMQANGEVMIEHESEKEIESKSEKEVEQERECASEIEQEENESKNENREVAERKERRMEPQETKEKESSLDKTNQPTQTNHPIPSLVVPLLQKFDKEMENTSPPISSIKVDFVLGAAIPNQPAYRSPLAETFPYVIHYKQSKDSRSNPFEERGDDVILVGCPMRLTKVGCPIDEKQSGLSNEQGSIAKGAAIYLECSQQKPNGLEDGEAIFLHLIQAIT